MNYFLDSEEFDSVAYSYRSWPVTDPAGVVKRFEELKDFIRKEIDLIRSEDCQEYEATRHEYSDV